MSKNINYSFFTIFIFLSVLIIGCNKTYSPKPYGYLRINFPEKKYNLFDTTYPYKFEYPEYGNIKEKKIQGKDNFWMDIEFPEFNGKIHVSYMQIDTNLNQLTEDSRTFVYKHIIKANAINENLINNDSNKVYGILYDIKGNAASSIQFYLTDSSENFLRGALYFYTQPNIDSLAPIISFFKKDIEHFINTLEWK